MLIVFQAKVKTSLLAIITINEDQGMRGTLKKRVRKHLLAMLRLTWRPGIASLLYAFVHIKGHNLNNLQNLTPRTAQINGQESIS